MRASLSWTDHSCSQEERADVRSSSLTISLKLSFNLLNTNVIFLKLHEEIIYLNLAIKFKEILKEN